MTEEAEPVTYPSGIPKPEFDAPAVAPEVMILTGMSGAGRTRAAAALGDLGWYVVDNLPPQLLGGLVTMVGRDPQDRLAVVVDVRGGNFFQDVEAVLDDLATRGIDVRLIFLDASDNALVRRFEEARRPHPLQRDGTLLEGIGRERVLVEALRDRADVVIDTSDLNVHELRDAITIEVGHTDQPLSVNIVSFGFRNGLPSDADFVADVRFLPNPHWVPALRALTGLDDAVRDHVLKSDGAAQFLDNYTGMLESVLSLYRAHDKHSVTVAIGCTGGKHRSVAIAEEIGKRLRVNRSEVRVTHRDRPTE
ncbi:RNase adapter RapZ [Demequina sp.]|uniref:RNase adapter RapZ n=1 Tax=Demequina sp. TaxID=2050685 RepID=UPI0025C29205|nr:RNase adapter RapZ [Demequina sp.]